MLLHPLHPFLEGLHERGEECACGFVGQFAVGVEFIGAALEDDFGAVHRNKIDEHARLPQMILRFRSAAHAGRGGHHRARLAIERIFFRWPRSPIDRVLQHTGHGVIIFGRRKQERVGVSDLLFEPPDLRRNPGILDILIIEWKIPDLCRLELDSFGREFDRGREQHSIERCFAQAAEKGQNLDYADWMDLLDFFCHFKILRCPSHSECSTHCFRSAFELISRFT